MAMNRREFLKIMGGTTAALAFPGVLLQGCKKAIEKATERTQVIWIMGQSCSGCSISLLNKVNPGIDSFITEHIGLNYHPTIMGATGYMAINILEEALKKKRKDFVLVVEGSIPTKNHEFCKIGEVDGHHVSVKEWVEELGKNARAVIAIGSCAAYGGVPAAKNQATGENPTGAVSVSEIIKDKTIINIPGCPPHPDWMIGTILHVILKGIPKLDEYGRPKVYFGKTVHEQCEKLFYYKRGIFAKKWGDEGCLYELGCLGMDSGCDIPSRRWNDGVSTCTESGAGCIGCTEKVFPDYGKRGMFQHLEAKNDMNNDKTKLAGKGVVGGKFNG